MPTTNTSPHALDTNCRPDELPDVETDDGLRHAIKEATKPGWWDTAAGRNLLAEIRRRAVRNAAHIATHTETPNGRDLVDDIVMAAWLVLHHHPGKVAQAARPWAYLMSSAQRQVIAEVRAQQLLTKPSSIQGRAREVLPRAVNPIGSTTTDLTTALRHEPRGTASDAAADPHIPCQVHQPDDPPLLDTTSRQAPDTSHSRPPWLSSFIDLLAGHGANPALAAAAVDRLADILDTTTAGRWEWVARRDTTLAMLGLTPDQASALVALVAGSRRYRHTDRSDSVLHAVRHANSAQMSRAELSSAQALRLDTYAGQRVRSSRKIADG